MKVKKQNNTFSVPWLMGTTNLSVDGDGLLSKEEESSLSHSPLPLFRRAFLIEVCE